MTDPLNTAIAKTQQVPGIRAEFTINTSTGKKPAAVELPSDLTEGEAFAVMVHVGQVCRQVSLAAEQKKAGGLVLARGALPRNGV